MDEPDFEHVDKFVCQICVVDDYLATLVEQNSTTENCSYCDNTSTQTAPFAVVMEVIYSAISQYFGDARINILLK